MADTSSPDTLDSPSTLDHESTGDSPEAIVTLPSVTPAPKGMDSLSAQSRPAEDTAMASSPLAAPDNALLPPEPEEPKIAGYSRFEVELEFVQCLANPGYLNHLASQKYLEKPEFIAWLEYLQYWTRPPYLKYLQYPGPTLNNLALLQTERFRQDILSPAVMEALAMQTLEKFPTGRPEEKAGEEKQIQTQTTEASMESKGE